MEKWVNQIHANIGDPGMDTWRFACQMPEEVWISMVNFSFFVDF